MMESFILKRYAKYGRIHGGVIMIISLFWMASIVRLNLWPFAFLPVFMMFPGYFAYKTGESAADMLSLGESHEEYEDAKRDYLTFSKRLKTFLYAALLVGFLTVMATGYVLLLSDEFGDAAIFPKGVEPIG